MGNIRVRTRPLVTYGAGLHPGRVEARLERERDLGGDTDWWRPKLCRPYRGPGQERLDTAEFRLFVRQGDYPPAPELRALDAAALAGSWAALVLLARFHDEWDSPLGSAREAYLWASLAETGSDGDIGEEPATIRQRAARAIGTLARAELDKLLPLWDRVRLTP